MIVRAYPIFDMKEIRLKKGHDIVLAGRPEKRLVNAGQPARLKIRPADFRGIKPKLMIKEGDHVKTGSPVFYSKTSPGMFVTAPGSGRIIRIAIGERRAVEEIVIDLDRTESFEKFERFNEQSVASLSSGRIKEQLLRSGLWPVIRQRPFSSVADPEKLPKAVFVPAMSTAPFAPDTDFVLDQDATGFQMGLSILKRLSGSPVHLVAGKNTSSEVLAGAKDVVQHCFSGPHPAGNVGIHIHHIAPIRSRDDIVWYVSLQDVLRIGRLFLRGRFPVEKIVTVGGESVERRQYVKIRQGMMLEDILWDNRFEKNARLISGDVLTGLKSLPEDPLGFYHEIISVIPEKTGRDFMGWIKPGLHKYSVTNLFLSRLRSNRGSRLDTGMNGSTRVIIPFGNIESVLPMNILPTFLIKMTLARDIDEMEKLGIYECDPEDFALCSFVDASKMEIAEIIREGLEYVEENG